MKNNIKTNKKVYDAKPHSQNHTLPTLLLFTLFLFYTNSTWAFSVQHFQPKSAHTAGFNLFTSDSIKQNTFEIGFTTNYVTNPLEAGLATGGRTLGVVDQFITSDFLMAYGITDWLTISANLPLNMFHNLAPGVIPTRNKGGPELGDISFNLKFRLLDANTTKGNWGLTLTPYMTAPTGKQSVYIGDNSSTGGFVLSVDKLIHSNRIFLNVGAKFKKREQFFNLDLHHELTFGIGYQRPLVKKWNLDVIAEVYGSTVLKNFFKDEKTTVIEADVVLQKRFFKKRWLAVSGGIGRGLTGGYGAPDWRGFIGLSFSFKGFKANKKTLLAPAIVYFPFNKYTYLPMYDSVIDGIVKYAQSNPKTKLMVSAYTDSTGKGSYNLKLSKKRAQTIRQALIDKGIPSHRIIIKPYGETNPVNTNQTKYGRSKNRRAEAMVTTISP